MLRISKLTDYGIVLLAHFAQEPPDASLNAREMAEATGLPAPVVSKMLKALSAAALLHSQRGAKGGYRLARAPSQVTVAEIVERLEGPIALMACSAGPGHCEQESVCQVRAPWQRINRAVQGALERVTLEDLARPGPETSALLAVTAEEEASRPLGAS
jgi:FeS assembly SUF system regulator